MKNLLLISLDTVRADVAYSGRFPFLNRLLPTGVTFRNVVSSAPITPISHASVFTGLQPYNHGVRHLFREQLPASVPTIASVLKKKKYNTGAVVSCPGMNKWYGFNRGFDYYDDSIPLLADGSDPLQTIDVKKRGTALKRANLVTEKAIRWMEQQKGAPFFLFMHFFDAHWPYEAPENHGGINVYEQEVAFTLHHLELFFQKAEQSGWLENTTVVLFSDHGEDLEGFYENDKGGAALGHPEESGHGCLLYNQTQKVVLFIRDPSLPVNYAVEQQVRLVDIAPTTFKLLGIKSDTLHFDGQNILPFIGHEVSQGQVAYSETCYPQEQFESTGLYKEAANKISYLMDNKFKLILHEGSGFLELYNLENDPNELHNLAKN